VQLPNAKELAALAKACRKAGISTFKGGGIEFTLTDAIPSAKSPKKAAKEAAATSNEIENDDLPYESMLHWSVHGIEKDEKDQA
jgi:hypothetical protein